MNLRICFLVCMFLIVQISSGLRILGIFPIFSNSHFNVCKGLLQGLIEHGHQVDVYSPFPLKKPIENYTDYSLAGSMFTFQNNVSYDLLQSLEGIASMKKLVDLTTPTCELMNLPVFEKLFKNSSKDLSYDIVIVEVFLNHCYLAWGRFLNIPMVRLVTLPSVDWLNYPLGNPTNLAVNPSLFSGFIVPMTFLERLQNVLLTYYIICSFNYHIRSQDEIIKQLFGPDCPSAVELQKDVSLVLLNHHHALNGVKAFTPAMIPVGGLHILDKEEELPKEVLEFLDESKSGFIYVAFGSMVRLETFPKSVLEVFYKTFEKIKPVRVLMKIAKPKELPSGLPSNVITYHWLPQVTVLKHKNIKAFVTHGGLMSTQESIYFGVPMIGFPLFVDQHLNIESYVRKNLAIKLDHKNVSEAVFIEAIMSILKNPIYKNSVEKVSKVFRDNPMPSRDTAVFWIEYIARNGKDALRSQLVDISWWQTSLLDVYAFIIAIVWLMLYVIKVIIKKLLKLFHGKKSLSSRSKVKKN